LGGFTEAVTHDDSLIFGGGAVECSAEGAAEIFAGEGEKLACRLAARLVEVGSGIAVVENDLMGAIDGDGGGGEMLEEKGIGELREGGAGGDAGFAVRLASMRGE